MCKGSVNAKKTVDAKHGDVLEIGVSSHGLAAFHAKGTPVAECVTCVQDETVMTFRAIPLDLQNKYGIGPMAVVDFIDKGHNTNDVIDFRNGKQATLAEFARKGVIAYVGELECLTDDDEVTTELDLDIAETAGAFPEEHFLETAVADVRAASVYSA